jgi:FMN phosphatase YigB (HAD superfamily)
VLTELELPGDQVALFEDSYKNLVTAKAYGMTTVLIHSDTVTEEGVTADKLAQVSIPINFNIAVEDSYKNLVTAEAYGMTTVLIHSDTVTEEGVTPEILAQVIYVCQLLFEV